jgi:effector-binding domain-containing protein
MPDQEIVVKSIPAEQVASLRDTVPTPGHIGSLINEAFGFIGGQGLVPVGPPMMIYHDTEFREADLDVEVAIPVGGPLREGERVKARELPAVPTMACVIHEGGYETIGGTYGQAMAWIEANGHQIAGALREIYLRGPESGDDSSRYLTEIQLPVERE